MSRDDFRALFPRNPSLTAVLGLMAGSGSVLYAFLILPYQTNDNTKAITVLQAQVMDSQRQQSHTDNVMTRLDSDVYNLEVQIAELQSEINPNHPPPVVPQRAPQ